MQDLWLLISSTQNRTAITFTIVSDNKETVGKYIREHVNELGEFFISLSRCGNHFGKIGQVLADCLDEDDETILKRVENILTEMGDDKIFDNLSLYTGVDDEEHFHVIKHIPSSDLILTSV